LDFDLAMSKRKKRSKAINIDVGDHGMSSMDALDVYESPLAWSSSAESPPPHELFAELDVDANELRTQAELWASIQEEQRLTSASNKKRGQSLNHLLNFSYQQQAGGQRKRGSGYSSSSSSSSSSQSHARRLTELKKKLYIQANFQVVLSAEKSRDADVASVLYDCDAPLDWRQLIQVRVCPGGSGAGDSIRCAICLESDAMCAPRMTCCGHLFCFACLLEYAAHAQFANGSAVQCPMCAELVMLGQLKPAHIERERRRRVAVGDRIHMVLVRRKECATVCAPVSRDDDGLTLPKCGELAASFNRVLLGSADVEAEIALRDIEQLERAADFARSCQDRSLPFIEQALDIVRPSLARRSEAIELGVGRGDDERHHAALSSSPSAHIFSRLSTPERRPSARKSSDKYFYQAESGEHVFLDPLCVRMLLKRFGSFARMPASLDGDVLQLDECVVADPSFRKRYSYLAHLPLSTTFRFAELGVSSLVGAAVARQFAAELGAREAERQRRSASPPPPQRLRPRPATPPDPSTMPTLADAHRSFAEASSSSSSSSANDVDVESVATPLPTKATPVPLQGVWKTRSSPAAPTAASRASNANVKRKMKKMKKKQGEQFDVLFSTTNHRRRK
jgi:E3 ubiquitin-protein ligase RNF10